MNGVFHETLVEYYIQGKTISFTCNELHDAEPRDPSQSDLHAGIIKCGNNGWTASHFCHPGNRTLYKKIIIKLNFQRTFFKTFSTNIYSS